MLKTIGSSVASAFRVDDDEVVGKSVIIRSAVSRSDTLRKSAKSKSQTKSGHLGNSNDLEKPKFLTPKAKKVFNRLSQAFIKALILQHFDPECHISIKTDMSSYAIIEVLS